MSTWVDDVHKNRFEIWMGSVVAWPGRIRRAYTYRPRHRVFLFMKAWELL